MSRFVIHPRFLSSANIFKKHEIGGKFFPSTYFSRRISSQWKENPMEFDYLIVGAGTAGCVLARELCISGNKVAIIENGISKVGKGDLSLIKLPLLYKKNMHNKSMNYCYSSEPQAHLNNRQLYCARGKTLGGSSAINTMVYTRGHPMDFNRWSEEGAEAWDFLNCLPYFKNVETCSFKVDQNFRGMTGPLHLSRASGKDLNPLSTPFFKSCNAYGLTLTEDFNGYSQEGYGLFDRTIYNGFRQDTHSTFLNEENYSIKENLVLLDDHNVIKINFSGTKATGITVLSNTDLTNPKTFSARKEVILSAGAIETPKLLMLSGIGDEAHLKANNITVVHHLPGVGQNLQDHFEINIQHTTNSPDTLYSVHNSRLRRFWEIIKHVKNKNGAFSSMFLDVGAFLSTDPIVSHPNIQIHFIPYGGYLHHEKVCKYPSFQIHIGTLREFSKGSVKLRSNDYESQAMIDYNCLDDERDLTDLIKCLDIGREILNQQPLKDLSTGEISPGPQCVKIEEKKQYIRNKLESAHQPCCTCKMGSDSDEMAVLDSQLKVRGIKNLRVVDASAFPSITSGNIHAAVIMLAAKAADIITGNNPPIADNIKFRENDRG